MGQTIPMHVELLKLDKEGSLIPEPKKSYRLVFSFYSE